MAIERQTIIQRHTEWLNELEKHSFYVENKINRGIEENRKGLFRLQIVNQAGEKVDCKHVKIRQRNHEFKFGSPLFVLNQLKTERENEKYKELFHGLFNYAVAPMYRRDLEPVRGRYRFDKGSSFIWRRPPLDDVVEFCKKYGKRLKGHCLAYNSFNPEWMQEYTYREMNASIEEYFAAIANRYGNTFEDIDVINEMYTIYKNGYKGNGERNLPITDEPDHIAKMFRLAKKYFPYSRLFWNEGSVETFGYSVYKGQRSTYYMMLKEQITAGVPVEGIGMQYHMFGTQGTQSPSFICNPMRMLDVFERYGDFSLPIHVSEVSVPSYSAEQEDMEMQAEIAKRLYRLFFSQKQVESIVWWNFADGMAFQGENAVRAGLLHNDLTPKPAFYALDTLINGEWKTELDVKTEEGEAEFFGFYGDYEVECTVGEKKYNESVRLYKENTGYDNRLGGPRVTRVQLRKEVE